MAELKAFRIILQRAAEAQHKSREWHDYGERCERAPDLMPSRIQAQKNAQGWADEAQQLMSEFWQLWRPMRDAHIRAALASATDAEGGRDEG